MQYILEEKEYAQLLKWPDVQKALTELEADLRPIFQGMCRNSMAMPMGSSGFEHTREFKEYAAAFEKFAKKL